MSLFSKGMLNCLHKNVGVILFAYLLGGLLWGCRKNDSQFEPYPPSAPELLELLNQTPDASEEFTTTIQDFSRDTILTLPSGVRIWIEDVKSLLTDHKGQVFDPVDCSALRIRVMLLEKNGGAIIRGLSSADESGRPLDLYGVIQIEFACETHKQPLTLANGRSLKIQIPAAAPLTNSLRLYTGVYKDNNPNIANTYWSAQADTLYWANWQSSLGQTNTGYEFYTNRLGYVAWGKPFVAANSVEQGNVCVTLPTGHSVDNTLVLLVFRQRIGAITLADAGNKAGGLFCAKGVPVGYPVRAIAISKVGDDWLMGWIDTETAPNTSVEITLKDKTPDQIIEYLRTL